MAISDYLNKLISLKNDLLTTLKEKGVSVQDDVTLNELVPLVNELGTEIAVEVEPIEKVLYSFGVLSDVHIRHSDWDDTAPESVIDVNDTRNHLQNALTFYKNNGVDFICVAGDVVWNGTHGRSGSPTDEEKIDSANEWFSEISLYKQYCDTYFDKPVYTITGNHDATTLGHSAGTNLGEIVPAEVYGDGTKKALEVWEEVIGNSLNYVVEQGDDIFIFLGMYYWNYINFYRDEDEDWIKEKLEMYKDKRVFLFFHVPLNGRFIPCEGMSETYAAGSVSRFRPLIASYPNVIWFSGHSHYGMDEEGSADCENPNTYQSENSMTMIHVPSCGYIRDYNFETGKSSRLYGTSQGLIVDVYDNKIVIKSIDFSQQNGRSLIQKAHYVINSK